MEQQQQQQQRWARLANIADTSAILLMPLRAASRALFAIARQRSVACRQLALRPLSQARRHTYIIAHPVYSYTLALPCLALCCRDTLAILLLQPGTSRLPLSLFLAAVVE